VLARQITQFLKPTKKMCRFLRLKMERIWVWGLDGGLRVSLIHAIDDAPGEIHDLTAHTALGLNPTFNTWAQITFLHMYLLTVRLRCFPPAHAPTWHQHLLDHFFYIAEDRMVTTHNIAARSIRNKYLKDLFVQWRGLMAGYDEGLVKGDAVLATAVWRNVFKGAEDVDFRGVAEIVSYVRGVLKGLDEMPDESVAGGEVVFGSPGTERDGILVKSRMMDAPGQLAGGTAEAGGKAKAVS